MTTSPPPESAVSADEDRRQFMLNDMVFQKAAMLTKVNNDALAVSTFLQAMRNDPSYFTKRQNLARHQALSPFKSGRHNNYDPATTRAYYLALSEVAPDLKTLLGPDITSCRDPAPYPDDVFEAMAAVLTKAKDDHEADRLPPPSQADSMTMADGSALSVAGKKITVIGLKYFRLDETFIEYDVTVHVLGSLRALGAEVQFLSYDDILKTDDHSVFVERINGFDPDLMVFDGASIPANLAFLLDWLAQRHRFDKPKKAIALFSDLYPSMPNWAALWEPHVDLMIALQHSEFSRRTYAAPLMVAPSLPFDTAYFAHGDDGPVEKDWDLLFVGSRSRLRDCWLSFAENVSPATHIAFTDRSLENGYDTGEYALLHRRAKTVFNNGPVATDQSIITGRFFEALLGHAVVLQEDTPAVADFFIPFVHYVPVGSVSELCRWVAFFARRPEWRARVADAAFDFWQTHYTADRFWAKALSMLK